MCAPLSPYILLLSRDGPGVKGAKTRGENKQRDGCVYSVIKSQGAGYVSGSGEQALTVRGADLACQGPASL